MTSVSGLIAYPGPGCVVEFLQDNKAVQGFVLEEQGGKVRLLLLNRRELSLPANRLLPWCGPRYSGEHSRQEMTDILQEHRARREKAEAAVDLDELWSLAQGEVEKAQASWLAELVLDQPDVDQVAGLGHALLGCKTHFRFNPPDFEIYPAERVAARTAELEAQREREQLGAQGQTFFQTLWDIHTHRQPSLGGRNGALPPDLAEKLKALLHTLMADPDDHEGRALWSMLSKGLPQAVRDDPFAPLHLAVAWGLVEPHHNIWLDRAGYEAGDGWAQAFDSEISGVAKDLDALSGDGSAPEGEASALPLLDLPFFSIDAPTTRDVDDAACLDPHTPILPDGSVCLHVCVACPAAVWPFEGQLDRAVQRRASSIYLPEATHHMLPEALGADQLSLLADGERPALVLSLTLSPEGELTATQLRAARVRLAANLSYADCERLLAGDTPDAENPALKFKEPLLVLERLAEALQARRIADGAVSIERDEPDILLHGEGEQVRVDIVPHPVEERSQRMVSEFMILTNTAVARWAGERNIPLLYRTQDLAVPREYAGRWKDPVDIARALRVLGPALLETAPRPHAALGLAAYAPSTSPLRRYSDFINVAQLYYYLQHGRPWRSREELEAALPALNARLEAVSQVQRFRPRYWKLLHFKQRGDKVWWDAVITEESDLYATVALPAEQLVIRTRRKHMGTRANPGQAVRVRIGKVRPLYNEIQVIDASEI